MRYESKGGIVTRSGAAASRSIAQRAEALLRSLVGISQAEVHLRPSGGVERVRVVADGGLSNSQIVQNIRSALLAAVGVALQPAQIQFVPAGEWQPAEPEPARAPTSPPEPAGNSSGPPRDVVGEAASAGALEPRPAVERRVGSGASTGSDMPRLLRDFARPRAPRAPVATELPAAAPARRAAPAVPPDLGREVAIGERIVRLEQVEIVRQAGRVRCRIVLSAAADRYSAVADCRDEPLAEVPLAARVTCDALRAGDLTTTHVEGATLARLAGEVHVVVALNGWKSGAAIRRSGSSAIRESPEYAAALAVLHALANS
jgi:hypothetical protein